MTTPEQRLEALKAAHDNAADNFVDDCLAATTTAQKNRIARNLLTLRGAYETAIKHGLEKNSSKIEAAYSGLASANADVVQARAEAQAIADLINKVTAATNFATRLVSLAII